MAKQRCIEVNRDYNGTPLHAIADFKRSNFLGINNPTNTGATTDEIKKILADFVKPEASQSNQIADFMATYGGQVLQKKSEQARSVLNPAGKS